MKLRIAYLIAVPATLLFTQCAEMAQELDAEVARENNEYRHNQKKKNHNSKTYKKSKNYQSSSTEAAPAYGLGFEKGRTDATIGKSSNPERHPGAYSEADRSDFFRGYKSGYGIGMQ